MKVCVVNWFWEW